MTLRQTVRELRSTARSANAIRQPLVVIAARVSSIARYVFHAEPLTSGRAGREDRNRRCLASGDGFLRARLDGALELKLDWDNAGTQCEGMPRPDGQRRAR